MVKNSQSYFKLTNGPDYKIQASLPNQETNSQSMMTKSNQETSVPSIIPEKEPGTSQSDQENLILALRTDKVLDKLPLRRNPESAVHMSHSDQGVTFSMLPEKPIVDGYNWRKYGQKVVKGNAFVRSYYKCTFSNCAARKQVERSHDGHITEINYVCKHEHPKPPHTGLKGSDEPSLVSGGSQEPEALSMVASSDNFVEVAVSKSTEITSEVNNNIPPDSKKQKRESGGDNDNVVMKTNYERVVVQTTSVVDIINDGYRWRKYGQKLVKGNLNPRSYYRRSSAGCPVKKHVERASHDVKVVITTYEGRHDHNMPSGFRTVAQNTHDDEPKPQQEANESSSMEMVVHVGAN